jgi:hypothetical protein
MDKENKVYIRRQLGASPEGEQDGQYIALNEISRLHWDDITGGFQKRTPYPQIMGYVDPADAPKVRCSGRHDYSRYGIKVCLIRSKTSPEVWEKVLQVVPECPYVKLPTCTKTILEILGNYPEGMTRKSLREQMLQKGYPSYRIRRAIKTMGPNHLGRQQFFAQSIGSPIGWQRRRFLKKNQQKPRTIE